ncbi:MAG TPA: hypothetical protein VNZ52_08285 [Candidatus Thermoplasmatota archaeon]|nr:hypothetical protein [Candidatus Thermoplasmatota archaeon]
MNRFILISTLVALVATGAGLSHVNAVTPPFQSGEHYTLNLVGVPEGFTTKGGSGEGHRIFVPLVGDCRINLSEGDFQVTDGNCADGSDAGFELPNPDPEQDGFSSYRVYVRALGKPGGSAELNTCREDSDGTWCSTETVYVARAAGYSPSMEVTKETLTVCYDKDGDGDADRETIFSDANANYFWSYQNSGLRLAQLRFYPNTPTDISAPCPAV